MQVAASFFGKPIVTAIKATQIGQRPASIEYISCGLHGKIACIHLAGNHAMVNFTNHLPSGGVAEMLNWLHELPL
jgi:hypothetical protein